MTWSVAAVVHGTQAEQEGIVLPLAPVGDALYRNHLAARVGEHTRHEAHVLLRNEAELRAALLDAGARVDVLVLVGALLAAVG